MDGIDVDCVDDKEERVLGVGAVATDQLDTLDVGVKQRVGPSFADRAGLRTVNLRDVEKHRTSLCRFAGVVQSIVAGAGGLVT